MNDDRSLERAARSWLEAGPTQAPDRAVETALLRIETTPQERDLRIPWRLPKMNTPARVASAAVIGVLAVGGAFFVLKPGQPAVGDLGPSQTATTPAPPTTSPTTSPITSPSQSPDDTRLQGWIVFEQRWGVGGQRRQIWLIHADGTGRHELAPGAPRDKYEPDIAPDGSTIAFSSSLEGDSPTKNQVWEVAIDGAVPRLLSTDCSGVPNVCMEKEPAYSPDGSRIAFVRWTAGGTTGLIGIRDLATGAVTLLEKTRTSFPTGELTQPSWSPDGRQIIFSTWSYDPQTGGDVSRISIVNADGTRLHELNLPTGTLWGDPDWSPDGSRIVLSGPKLNVYSVRPDGSDLKQLTDSLGCGGCGAPSWTPDGAHILFSGPATSGGNTFWLMDPDGANQRPINPSKLTFYGQGLLQPTP